MLSHLPEYHFKHSNESYVKWKKTISIIYSIKLVQSLVILILLDYIKEFTIKNLLLHFMFIMGQIFFSFIMYYYAQEKDLKLLYILMGLQLFAMISLVFIFMKCINNIIMLLALMEIILVFYVLTHRQHIYYGEEFINDPILYLEILNLFLYLYIPSKLYIGLLGFFIYWLLLYNYYKLAFLTMLGVFILYIMDNYNCKLLKILYITFAAMKISYILYLKYSKKLMEWRFFQKYYRINNLYNSNAIVFDLSNI